MEFNENLIILLIDSQEAFDSILRPALWEALLRQDVPRRLIRIIKEMYRNSEGRIRLDKMEQYFEISRGVK